MILDAARDVSVVICAYIEERWEELGAAVESIQRQSIPSREIIIVIDHNTQLFERARTYICGVKVIENSEPKGLSGARNSGIAVAQGTLIAFLDDDAIAEPDWLERLSRCCQDSQVLGAGGVVEPLWSSKRPTWFPEEFYWVVGCTYQNQLKTTTVVRNLYGGCACIRREVFEAVGAFRNGVGRVDGNLMGGEDTELCIRAVQFWPCKVFLCDPHARIHHHIPLPRARWHYFIARCYAEGISKAAVTRFVGARDGLAFERSYMLKVLPSGVAHRLMNGFLHVNLSEFIRIGAILCGFVITIVGYMVGLITQQVILHKVEQEDLIYNFKQVPHPKTDERNGWIQTWQ